MSNNENTKTQNLDYNYIIIFIKEKLFSSNDAIKFQQRKIKMGF